MVDNPGEDARVVARVILSLETAGVVARRDIQDRYREARPDRDRPIRLSDKAWQRKDACHRRYGRPSRNGGNTATKAANKAIAKLEKLGVVARCDDGVIRVVDRAALTTCADSDPVTTVPTPPPRPRLVTTDRMRLVARLILRYDRDGVVDARRLLPGYQAARPEEDAPGSRSPAARNLVNELGRIQTAGLIVVGSGGGVRVIDRAGLEALSPPARPARLARADGTADVSGVVVSDRVRLVAALLLQFGAESGEITRARLSDMYRAVEPDDDRYRDRVKEVLRALSGAGCVTRTVDTVYLVDHAALRVIAGNA